MTIRKSKKVSFSDMVREVVKNIPKGKTMSYKEVATACKKPKGARAVANVMVKNYDPKVPCHRVIHTNGKIGNYNRGGNLTKINLLTKEGCVIKDGYILSK